MLERGNQSPWHTVFHPEQFFHCHILESYNIWVVLKNLVTLINKNSGKPGFKEPVLFKSVKLLPTYQNGLGYGVCRIIVVSYYRICCFVKRLHLSVNKFGECVRILSFGSLYESLDLQFAHIDIILLGIKVRPFQYIRLKIGIKCFTHSKKNIKKPKHFRAWVCGFILFPHICWYTSQARLRP